MSHANTYGLFLWYPYDDKIMVLYLAYVRSKFYKSDAVYGMLFIHKIAKNKELF